MNYLAQSKRIKPNAKSCSWCKHYKSCYGPLALIMDAPTTHRQNLKIIRENNFRYCKNYRFSKQKFKEWKKFREENTKLQRFYNEQMGV